MTPAIAGFRYKAPLLPRLVWLHPTHRIFVKLSLSLYIISNILEKSNTFERFFAFKIQTLNDKTAVDVENGTRDKRRAVTRKEKRR